MMRPAWKWHAGVSYTERREETMHTLSNNGAFMRPFFGSSSSMRSRSHRKSGLMDGFMLAVRRFVPLSTSLQNLQAKYVSIVPMSLNSHTLVDRDRNGYKFPSHAHVPSINLPSFSYPTLAKHSRQLRLLSVDDQTDLACVHNVRH